MSDPRSSPGLRVAIAGEVLALVDAGDQPAALRDRRHRRAGRHRPGSRQRAVGPQALPDAGARRGLRRAGGGGAGYRGGGGTGRRRAAGQQQRAQRQDAGDAQVAQRARHVRRVDCTHPVLPDPPAEAHRDRGRREQGQRRRTGDEAGQGRRGRPGGVGECRALGVDRHAQLGVQLRERRPGAAGRRLHHRRHRGGVVPDLVEVAHLLVGGLPLPDGHPQRRDPVRRPRRPTVGAGEQAARPVSADDPRDPGGEVVVRGEPTAAGHQREALGAAGLQDGGARVVERGHGVAVPLCGLQPAVRHADGHDPPGQRGHQRDRTGEQPDADGAMGPAALADRDVDDRDQRGHEQRADGERDRDAALVGLGQLGGLLPAQLLGRREDRAAHELRRAAQVGLAQRQPLPVERARGLHQPGVDGQLGRHGGDRAAAGQPSGGVDQPVGGPGDVVVVAGPHGGGFAAARDVAARRHRVGVGERAVELGGVGGQRGDAGLRLGHRRAARHPGEHAHQRRRQAPDDQHQRHPEQPLRGRGPAPQRPAPRGRGIRARPGGVTRRCVDAHAHLRGRAVAGR